MIIFIWLCSCYLNSESIIFHYFPDSYIYVPLCRRTRCSKLNNQHHSQDSSRKACKNHEHTRSPFPFNHFG
ncbi:hypothetical protein HanXRQr2_Chr01g0028841 [Helianthus annuus]|uniref:Secreted protein n=1 Tax=Helianthus annuus TaxID=4232 RepID=A0A9K3P411_HELAN|nr:hypothetical protein HanXRQr2_Chr01g0028841 [Helianthus annuus]